MIIKLNNKKNIIVETIKIFLEYNNIGDDIFIEKILKEIRKKLLKYEYYEYLPLLETNIKTFLEDEVFIEILYKLEKEWYEDGSIKNLN